MHAVTNQITNTFKILGFCYTNNVERASHRIDGCHHFQAFQGLCHLSCLADRRLD